MVHPNSQLRGLGTSRKMEVGCCRGGGHSKEAVGVGEMRRCIWDGSWRWSRSSSRLALVELMECRVCALGSLVSCLPKQGRLGRAVHDLAIPNEDQ